MQDLKSLRMDELVDLLNKETTRYYTLFGDKKYTREIIKCKLIIHEIQKEIDSRKKKFSNRF
jgi:hypothetical protein